MFLVTIIPIARGIPLDELSYFSPHEAPVGSLATVPLRGKKIRGIITSSVPAHQVKADIKSANWSLKKLDQINATSFFREEYIRAVRDTANYFAASVGATLHAIFPEALYKLPHQHSNIRESSGTYHEELLFQDEDSERLTAYKSFIREEFAKNSSVYLILPSQQDIEHVYASLERGIRDYTFVFHGGIGAKELKKRWADAIALDHPVLIIATAYFLSIPRSDIGAIILDKESSPAYKGMTRPFVDLRYFARMYAKRISARIIYGDIFLRVETLARHEQGEVQSFARPKFRLVATGTQQVVDMQLLGEQPATGKIAICSPELVDLIEANRALGTHMFILGVRKGYAPMTVCGDCGTVVTCSRCSSPMVLHKKKQAVEEEEPDHLFLCHRCGEESGADLICKNCSGWRLIPLGIGITQAEEAIRGRFPDATIFRLDKDEVASHEEAQKRIEEFYQNPGSILIGTEMALSYLTEKIAHIAVLSVNSLLTIPDFRMSEKVFRLLLSLRSKAERTMLVQTRDPNHAIFDLALSGNIAEFFRKELEERKQLGYPPYNTFIKLTYEGGQEEGKRLMEEIERIFSLYHPVSFPSFIARVKGKYRMNAILTIPEGKWPNEELASLLRSLPPELSVKVDPESVI